MQYIRVIVIGILISLSSSYIIMSLSVYSEGAMMSGQDLLEEVVIAVVLGAVIGTISLIFVIERLLFTVQLIIHFLLITICVFVAGYFGNWYDLSKIETMKGIFVAIIIVYVITWLIIKLLLKKDVDSINEKIQQRRGEK